MLSTTCDVFMIHPADRSGRLLLEFEPGLVSTSFGSTCGFEPIAIPARRGDAR